MDTRPLASHSRVHPVDNETGYRAFEAGAFKFVRDEYFAYIEYPTGRHIMSIDDFLRALMRDVAWNFFYGTVNFDSVFGTTNYYGEVEMFAGLYNDAYVAAGRDYAERFKSDDLMAVFHRMITDWTNRDFDPFAAPMETGDAWGVKDGDNVEAVDRAREAAKRMVGLPGDAPLRTDDNGRPVNRMFADVDQSEPEVHVEPGFETEVGAFNLFAYLSRSDVTWNPSVCSVVRDSLYCPTSEEYILPIEHGNDRVEWFLQMSDQITWQIKDGKTGRPRAQVTMRPGDICAMPADIRHQGYSPKRCMLMVMENGTPDLAERYASGELDPYPIPEDRW